MWLSWTFKRHRTKSFTGGNLGNRIALIYETEYCHGLEIGLRENRIKDRLQQGKEWTWTSPYHVLQNKICCILKALNILKKDLKDQQNHEMSCKCWRLWWSSDSWGMLCLLLSGGLKYPMQKSAAEQLLAGLCDPCVAETKYQHSRFWILLFICFATEVGLN